MWNIRVTDLMQGPVYGIFTEETRNDPNLVSFFNYDELFGTVVNRFVVQAVSGYPLTVFGKGGQTRGYLNIKDTLNCVRLSIENPSAPGELRIFNQLTETFSVNELADRIKSVGDSMGLNVQIKNVTNPRVEEEEHYYNPKHSGLLELGLKPNYLTDSLLEEMMSLVKTYKNNIEPEKFLKNVMWVK